MALTIEGDLHEGYDGRIFRGLVGQREMIMAWKGVCVCVCVRERKRKSERSFIHILDYGPLTLTSLCNSVTHSSTLRY